MDGKPALDLWDLIVCVLGNVSRFVFSDSVLCLGKVNQNPTSNVVWEEKLSPSIESMEFESNIFPGFTTLQLISKVQEFMTKMGDPSHFKRRIISMSKDNERECNANATLVLFLQKDSQEDVGHSSDLDQKRSGILLTLANQKENGTESLNG